MRSCELQPVPDESKSDTTLETDKPETRICLSVAKPLMVKFDYFYDCILALIRTSEPNGISIDNYAMFFLYITLEIAKPNFNALVIRDEATTKSFLTDEYFKERLNHIRVGQPSIIDLHKWASHIFDPKQVQPMEKSDTALLECLRKDINYKKTRVSTKSSHEIQRLNFFFTTIDVKMNNIYYQNKKEYLRLTRESQMKLDQDQIPIATKVTP
jgi:hypothetical protein